MGAGMKRLGLAIAALLLASTAHAQFYPLFGPSNGVMKGSTTSPQTTTATGADITALFSQPYTTSPFFALTPTGVTPTSSSCAFNFDIGANLFFSCTPSSGSVGITIGDTTGAGRVTPYKFFESATLSTTPNMQSDGEGHWQLNGNSVGGTWNGGANSAFNINSTTGSGSPSAALILTNSGINSHIGEVTLEVNLIGGSCDAVEMLASGGAALGIPFCGGDALYVRQVGNANHLFDLKSALGVFQHNYGVLSTPAFNNLSGSYFPEGFSAQAAQGVLTGEPTSTGSQSFNAFVGQNTTGSGSTAIYLLNDQGLGGATLDGTGANCCQYLAAHQFTIYFGGSTNSTGPGLSGTNPTGEAAVLYTTSSAPIMFGTNSAAQLELNPGGSVQVFAPVQLNSYIVTGLPTCNSGTKGDLAYVTDATSPTYNSTLSGSGSVIVLAFCNGTNWTAH